MPNTYWKKYDFLYKKHSKKTLYHKLRKQCSKIKAPYTKQDNRGRKPKFTPKEYAAYLAIQKIFRHRYRTMELEATLYLPQKADHSTFARNYNKIPEEYLERLITSFVNKEFGYWIADSTAMSTKIREERTHHGTRKKFKLHDKYHVIIGYDPPTHTTMILNAKATDQHVSDSQAAQEMLKGKDAAAWFLGDSAYNTYDLHKMVEDCGLLPQMKPDRKGIGNLMSPKGRNTKMFSKRLYRELRGVVETVFGGSTNAGLVLTYAKKEHTRRLDTLMLAVRHNLFANLRVWLNFIMRQTRFDKPFGLCSYCPYQLSYRCIEFPCSLQ